MLDKLRERYKDLVIGDSYLLEDNTTNIKITNEKVADKNINTFLDNNNVWLKTKNGKYIKFSESIKPKVNEQYKLLQKEPYLLFEGDYLDKSKQLSLEGIKSQIEDYTKLKEFLGRELVPTEIAQIYSMFDWDFRRSDVINLHDAFSSELDFKPFNGNPAASINMGRNKAFIITLLTGDLELVAYEKSENEYGGLNIHLADDDFTVMSGSITLKEKYYNREIDQKNFDALMNDELKEMNAF